MYQPNTVWQFATAASIKFGRGCRYQLLDQLRLHGLSRPIVVLDATIRGLPLVSELLDSLATFPDVQSDGGLISKITATVFDGCKPEPTIDTALAACTAAVQTGADCVIGIGGGSNLDVAKITAVVARYGGQPSDYFGFDRVPGPVLPLFALPTTAGTGSEVSHSAVLTDVEQAVKVSTLSRWLRPTCAMVDPALTDSCPRTVTAHSGIDALVHAIEAYTNRDYSQMVNVDPQARAYEGSYPLTRLFAAEAIRLIGQSLVIACDHPHDKAARDAMSLAAMLAGMAFSNSGVGIVHALEYPIGAATHVGHGEGNGLLLPHVMRYNLPIRVAEFADIARWLGMNVVGLNHRQSAEAAIEAVVELQHSIGIRTRLSEIGLARESIPEMAAKAFEIKRLMDINPQTVQLSDLESILASAY
ncbi:MAG: iron-containing alcohol dehydrogenase [Pirellulaceae bacterium]